MHCSVLSSRRSFALALILCPALVVGPFTPAFAANNIEIDSSVTGPVYGNSDDDSGTNHNGSATGNTLHVTGDGKVTSQSDGDIWGAIDSTGTQDVSGNTVTVDAGAMIYGNVYGGEATGDKAATGNHVVINAPDTSSVYGGGNWDTGKVSANTVTITGTGTVYGDLMGGYSGAGESSGNTVTVSDGVTVTGSVYGGESDGDAATTGNHVILDGVTIDDDVFGGGNWGGAGEVSGNTTTITGSYVGLDVFGGRGEALVNGNTVTINEDSEIDGYVTGGWSAAGEANGNNVIINGGTINNEVYGGDGLVATGNSVLVNGTDAIVNDDIIGGWGDDEATGNSVTLQEGTVAVVFGGWSDGIASGNLISVTGGTVTDDISGGLGELESNDNIVSISGGETGLIYGGFSGSGSANGNTIEISGGTVRSGSFIYAGRGATDAINNTVTITGAEDLTGVGVYGGGSSGSGYDAFSGNTFNLKTPGLTIGDISGFENLNFYLPTDFAAGDAMLTVTSVAQLTEYGDGTGRSSVVNVGIDGGSSALQAGDQIVLIDAGSLITNEDLNTTATGYGNQGSTLNYVFDITAENNQLLASVQSAGASEGSKALSEGFISGLALSVQGADLAAGEGLGNALSATSATGATGSSFGSFGALSAGSLRYNTGSHVDVSSLSLLAGLAWGTDIADGRLTLGAFFEYGNGSYDTRNSFAGASANGDGDADYIGGGILGRMDFASFGSGHFYTEASARAGQTNNDFSGSNLNNTGLDTSYDSSSSYYGLHAGLGYVWDISDKTNLDLYGKYFWTHQEGDSVKLSTGDPVEFDDADSHRLRGGARLSYAANEYIAPYIGAAYEHEFDGEARATTYGYAIDAPDMKGGTGIGELGFTLNPSQTLPLSFDLGVQGYTGMREGVTGSLQARFEF